jgi:subtilisin family serine protease
MRRLLILLVALAAGSLLLSQAEAAQQPADVIPGRYIVVLEPAASPAAVAADHGLAPVHTYRAALNGFAAIIPPPALDAVARDPRVAFVEPDRAYTVADQIVPTGIDRIEADENPKTGIADSNENVQVNLDVAIIDTGINPHADLNLVGGRNFSGGSSNNYSDGYGHGTHVAGTVGAKDNGIGVVGVAPGASVWAVKVCNNRGICLTSNMIAGLDWVTGRKLEAHDGDADPGIDLAVANMSLGTSNNDTACDQPSTDALRNAVCGLVASGVPLALAAGNESTTKIAYEAAIAVSAIADYDGKGDGAYTGPDCYGYSPPYYGPDDTLANFSNFGSTIDIAAPGVCILSTSSSGGYAYGSGTSMAAPHVAGAVALYLHANELAPATNRDEADALRNAILSAAKPQSDPCGFTESSGDGSAEPLLFVNASAFDGDGTCDTATAEPTHDVALTAISASPDAATQGDTVTVTVDVANQGDFSETFDVTVRESPDGDNLGTQSITLAAGATDSLTFRWVTNTATAEGDHTITATASTVTDETDTADNTKTAVVTVSSSIGGTLNVMVQAGTPIQRGPNWHVDIAVTVTDSNTGAAVSGAIVNLKVRTGVCPGSDVVFDRSATTNGSGSVTLGFKTQTTGTYCAAATATASGYNQGSGSDQFTVP